MNLEKRHAKSKNLRFFPKNLFAPHLRGFFLTKKFFLYNARTDEIFLSDSFFVQFFFQGAQMQNLLMIDFLFFMVSWE